MRLQLLTGGGDFVDNVVEVVGSGEASACASRVANGAEANDHLLDLLPRKQFDEVAHAHDHAVAHKAVALVGEVKVRQFDILGLDVLPDIHLRPVT